MLPKGLYELLPYFYMAVGGSAVLFYGGLAIPLGTALYLFGAWVWITRSQRRRRNARERQSESARPFLNELFYESLPFVYSLTGIYLFALLDHPVRYISGALLIVTGIILSFVRAQARKKFQPRVEKGSGDAVDRLIVSVAAADSARRAGSQSERAGSTSPPQFVALAPDATPPGLRCDVCAVGDICGKSGLSRVTVAEVMRLSQSSSPDEAYALFRNAVSKSEGRDIPDSELLPILRKLHAYASLCASWRQRVSNG